MINLSQEKVVNSLINKNLDWDYGEITQTGVNTYYYKAETVPPIYIMDRIPKYNGYSGYRIEFINGSLTITQDKVMYSARLSGENEEILKEHINNKILKKQEETNTGFIDWIG